MKVKDLIKSLNMLNEDIEIKIKVRHIEEDFGRIGESSFELDIDKIDLEGGDCAFLEVIENE